MAITKLHLKQRAEKGARFLDNHPKVPADWHQRIDLDKLEMNNPFKCVLGQLFEDYYCGRKELVLFVEQSIAHGFSGKNGDDEHALTPIWYDILEARMVNL